MAASLRALGSTAGSTGRLDALLGPTLSRSHCGEIGSRQASGIRTRDLRLRSSTKSHVFSMEMGGRDNRMTTAAEVLLQALAEGREQEAWANAGTLAKAVVDSPMNVLAKAVLDGGPFAMRKAEELAELVIGKGDALDDEGEQGANGR
jgi:hypothetical protein